MTRDSVQPIVDGQSRDSEDRVHLSNVDGSTGDEVHVVPSLGAQLALRRLRDQADGQAPEYHILKRAAELYLAATIDGMDRNAYARKVALVTGVPIEVIQRGIIGLASGCALLNVVNESESPSLTFPQGFEARWLPRGKTFASVLVFGNHPGPNLTWLRALSTGYSVAIRPGVNDPFTPRRLALALLEAGLAPHKLAFLPGDDQLGEYLLREADLGVMYGASDKVAPWAVRSDMMIHGPGRSKALLDSDAHPEVIDHLAHAVSGDAGIRCNNMSAIFTRGDHVAVAEELARRLATLRVAPITAKEALLPAISAARSPAMRAYLADFADSRLTDHSSHLYEGKLVCPSEDGSHVLRPLVLSTSDPDHPLLGTELPFPFVIVAPWRTDRGVKQLGTSLVANLITDDDHLIDAALADPTIRKVVRGLLPPWTSVPTLPDDGNLAGFLMEPKVLVSSSPSRTVPVEDATSPDLTPVSVTASMMATPQ